MGHEPEGVLHDLLLTFGRVEHLLDNGVGGAEMELADAVKVRRFLSQALDDVILHVAPESRLTTERERPVPVPPMVGVRLPAHIRLAPYEAQHAHARGRLALGPR